MLWIISVSENRDDCVGIFFVVHPHNREFDIISFRKSGKLYRPVLH
jgi:hypothetical protein